MLEFEQWIKEKGIETGDSRIPLLCEAWEAAARVVYTYVTDFLDGIDHDVIDEDFIGQIEVE